MSANDPIEKLFRDNQHGLDEKPRDLLWSRIEEQLEEDLGPTKKRNWWKYGIAASLILGVVTATTVFLTNQNKKTIQLTEPAIVFEPAEINEDNASEMLDKAEENKQSVATKVEKPNAPEIVVPGIVSEDHIINDPIYDVADEETIPEKLDEYEAPMMIPSPANKAKDEVLVYGNLEKKEDKHIRKSKKETLDYELDNERRLGNASKITEVYPRQSLHQIQVPYGKSLLDYDLISQDSNQLIFVNSTVSFPTQIIFIDSADSIQVIYSGNEKNKNSKESSEIQRFINENKVELKRQFFK